MNREVVLVTGASSELGRELVARLARSGAPERVILAHYFTNPGVLPQETRVVPLQADFGDAEAVQRMAERVLADFGAPHKIVHLPATRLRYERFAKFDPAHFDRDFSIQFRSIVTLLCAFLPAAIRARKEVSGGGNTKVVFALSSVVIGAPPKYLAMYTAAKYALLGLMRSLAVEYADSCVNVNALSPSMMETQFLASIPAKAIELSAAANPTGRNVATGDVAPLIEFLLSSESDYINGANIPVTGGAIF
jgi:3-oxoacyl-[acyl-carrier protein] reductase